MASSIQRSAISSVFGQPAGDEPVSPVSMTTRAATRSIRLARGAASGTLRARSARARESMKQAELNVCPQIGGVHAPGYHFRWLGDGSNRTCLADARGAGEAQARPGGRA